MKKKERESTQVKTERRHTELSVHFPQCTHAHVCYRLQKKKGKQKQALQQGETTKKKTKQQSTHIHTHTQTRKKGSKQKNKSKNLGSRSHRGRAQRRAGMRMCTGQHKH
eukprot:TRINITY_DN11600_c1_g1_i1.p3 TRINITY_DN11600_c1_g1~~TRINITY_DN11600_c1_g1_i1.p3  ORF type:complete len:109 (+),score=5.00 TRINITY_DN11600_c1_g1_i1:148-474(+)